MKTVDQYVREAERLVSQAHHFTYGDGADTVAGHALAAEAQVYATLASVAVLAMSAPSTVYRAEHPDSGITLGLYTTAAAARTHCETVTRREIPGATLDWIEDDEDRVAELVAAFGEDERPTGYVVTAIDVDSEYDEGADE